MHEHDDEVTTDVDPDWIAAIRDEAEVAAPDGTSPAEASGDADAPEDERPEGGADWFDAELKWDAEATVGVSAGLIDRIRAEIGNERDTDPSVVPPPPTSASPPVAAPPTTPPRVDPPPVVAPPREAALPTVVPPADAPRKPDPLPAGVPVTTDDTAASTTVRWEPRQRLAMSAPVKESAAIVDDSRHTGLDRTKVAIAVIVAITVLLVVWLVSRSGDGDPGPTPEGTVPAASTPADPGPADDAGAGG